MKCQSFHPLVWNNFIIDTLVCRLVYLRIPSTTKDNLTLRGIVLSESSLCVAEFKNLFNVSSLHAQCFGECGSFEEIEVVMCV